MARKLKVPVYIQDLTSGAFAEVVEQEDDGECFAYFVNTITGWANGSRGSISFNREDEDIKFLGDILSVKLYQRILETRERSNGMIEHKQKELVIND